MSYQSVMKIKVEDYFPFHFKIIGYGFMIGSFLALFSNLITAPILLTIGILLSTTHYGFELNQENKTYREYTWFFGYKKGSITPFSTVNFIYINQSKYTVEYGSMYMRRLAKGQHYLAYIKIDEEKILLGSWSSKEQLYSSFSDLNIEIRDNSK